MKHGHTSVLLMLWMTKAGHVGKLGVIFYHNKSFSLFTERMFSKSIRKILSYMLAYSGSATATPLSQFQLVLLRRFDGDGIPRCATLPEVTNLDVNQRVVGHLLELGWTASACDHGDEYAA
jgi:hypothetical protein